MDNIYRENILDHYKNPRNYGRMRNPDIFHIEENPFCGDKICMQVKFSSASSENCHIKNLRFFGEGCAISTASASMLSEKVIGETLAQAKKIGRKEILDMLGISLSPTRLKCALLPLETLHKILSLVKTK